ncbi:hypothetical protein ILUMI_01047 [Ignelater luminosus]|uniref:Uncharacterized protein n=1 Tax=Ignelater luminosus TaxID=2038154 RepID=A0A8K0DG35_IGNLU|nr:hypothetical protein ILUMI_01047 [Ignelater luminosus]
MPNFKTPLVLYTRLSFSNNQRYSCRDLCYLTTRMLSKLIIFLCIASQLTTEILCIPVGSPYNNPNFVQQTSTKEDHYIYVLRQPCISSDGYPTSKTSCITEVVKI